MFFLVLISTLISHALCHMSMQFHTPRDTLNGASYAKWQQNEPMVPMHPQTCHGLASTSVHTRNSFSAGDSLNIDLYGTASHAGGHCAFWYSTDDRRFNKIMDMKDCTLNTGSIRVTLPSTMPTQCRTKCTFAWTWVPVNSAVCEIYMNCADISVSGVRGGGNSNSIDFRASFINS